MVARAHVGRGAAGNGPVLLLEGSAGYDLSGSEISAADISETLGFFDSWEDRYRYIIDLGRQLPAMPEERKRPELLVRGCQSQVWLDWREDEAGRLHFEIDSDAHIVRGLIAILFAMYQGRTPDEILAVDARAGFAELGLAEHLTPQRSNGFFSMVERIRRDARALATA